MPKARKPKLAVRNDDVEMIVRAECSDPFRVLGAHLVKREKEECFAVRAFLPRAKEVEVVPHGSGAPSHAVRIHEAGFFEAVLPAPAGDASFAYRLRVTYYDGHTEEVVDPYSYPPLLSDFDLHLMNEGTHYEKYEKMGAHLCEVNGTSGVRFAVWAPNARRVSVVGDFNFWDGRSHPLRIRGQSGIWELFLPGLEEGLIYKFEILSNLGIALKSDPYGFWSEVRPKTASIVVNIDRYEWHDADWCEAREKRDWLAEPVSIYEVHLGSWRRGGQDDMSWLSYRDLAEHMVPYVKLLGFTHIELMPVMEHPFDGSWGYQTLGYFAATSRFGTTADLMYFIDHCHGEGIGVILDWTPAHFPRDAHGLAQFDGTHLYEHADPRKGAHPDWGTLVFNYGRNEVQNYLISNALFWMEKYHVDGLRVDAVASMLYLDYSRKPGEWIPNPFGGRENLEAVAFLKKLNEVVHQRHPGVLTIAEESTSWPMVSRPTYLGGLGFSLKWNLGWMHDTLDYFSRDPIHRKYHHNRMTFSMLYAFTENFVLPFSHDEMVHGKGSMISRMPGEIWQQFANLRLLYGYMCGHPGKKILFMGGEFGQWIEWDHDHSLDWHLLEYDSHRGVQRLVTDLNRLYKSEPALHEVDFEWHGFEWLDCNDADASVLSFLRRGRKPDDCVIVVCNFTPVLRENYRVSVPERGYYAEMLNTDSGVYGGNNMGNYGGVDAEPIPWLGHEWSIGLTLPPLATLFLKLRRTREHPC